VACAGPYSDQSHASTTALGAARRYLPGGVAHAHRGGPVGLRWRFFLSSLFLSHPLKKHA